MTTTRERFARRAAILCLTGGIGAVLWGVVGVASAASAAVLPEWCPPLWDAAPPAQDPLANTGGVVPWVLLVAGVVLVAVGAALYARRVAAQRAKGAKS